MRQGTIEFLRSSFLIIVAILATGAATYLVNSLLSLSEAGTFYFLLIIWPIIVLGLAAAVRNI